MNKSTKYMLAGLGAAAFGITAGMGIGGYISFLVGIKNTEKAKNKAIERSQSQDNNALNIEWFNNLNPEEISMLSEDGLQLRASFLRQPEAKQSKKNGYFSPRIPSRPDANDSVCQNLL